MEAGYDKQKHYNFGYWFDQKVALWLEKYEYFIFNKITNEIYKVDTNLSEVFDCPDKIINQFFNDIDIVVCSSLDIALKMKNIFYEYVIRCNEIDEQINYCENKILDMLCERKKLVALFEGIC